ncbi:MAG: Holliday junction branch migration protein RuvA [Anaerolinea sp.]|nr:Holliday junction branch migration protein RuvA [Anaerolinea sp.]
MIASLEGKVAAVAGDHLVVVVNGIGYKVFTPRNSLSLFEGEAVYLHTEMIVREDSITLYGFATVAERDVFNKLIMVSGVGPKLALSVLSTISIDTLRTAVATGNPDLLGRIPGVGKKMGEKIVFELKDKLKGADGIIAASSAGNVDKDVMDALIGFGYSIAEAQAALQSIPPDAPKDFDERMRRALQYFI